MKKLQLPICKAIYRGYNFIYKDRRGPLCSWDEISNSNAMSSWFGAKQAVDEEIPVQQLL